jgi:hypothetical protein
MMSCAVASGSLHFAGSSAGLDLTRPLPDFATRSAGRPPDHHPKISPHHPLAASPPPHKSNRHEAPAPARPAQTKFP